MLRLFIPLFIILSLLACKTKSQSSNDIISSLKLFKEGGDLMMQGFKLEFSDSLSSRKYYEKAIDTFLAAYRLDTSNIELGTYLSDLYYNVQKFDSALIWGLKLLTIDSLKNAKKVPIAFANSLDHLGFCYLNVGDIQTGRTYLEKALLINKRNTSLLAQKLLDLSDRIYFEKYSKQIDELVRRKIDP